MKKYPWADNWVKLNRAINKARQEQQPVKKFDARVKEIYVSYGGKLLNDITPSTEDNSNVKESESVAGGQDSSNDSTTG